MNTEIDALLAQFLAPDHAVLKDILTLWSLRGDGTQACEDRTRLQIGEQAYEHHNWDTVASNGRVLILARRYKHPQGVRPPLGFSFPAEWFWCLDQIEQGEDVEPSTPAQLSRVPEEVRASLKVLPDLEFVTVRRVNFWSHGRGKPKQKHKKPPEGIAFFRFQGGLGLCVTG